MKNTLLIRSVAVLAILAFPHVVQAAVVHDETVNGDLSGSFSTPTVLDFAVGDNTIIGQIGDNGGTGATDGTDADYFSVTIEADEMLESLFVDSYSFSGTNPGSSFSAYTIGGSFSGQGGGDIDGQWFFNADETSNGIESYAGGPLGPGTYSFWFQEIASTTVDYQITFNVTAVPEPASMSVLAGLAGLGMFGARRRKKRQMAKAN